jgi:Flp pilus assembly protein TadG
MHRPERRRVSDVAGSSGRGSIALQAALLLVVLLGMVSLAIEGGSVLLKQRRLQAAADSAALAGAAALTGAPGALTAEVKGVAATQGYTSGVGGTTVQVHNPPVTGAKAGVATAVEVVISQPQHMVLASLFGSGDFATHARSVGISNGGTACIFALDPSASEAVALKNNASITNPQCGLQVNSASATAVHLSNNATITGPVTSHGGIQLDNNASILGTPVVSYGAVAPNPYAGFTPPTAPACTGQSGTLNGTATLTAGHFCSGWKFSNNATITLSPGVYYVDSKMSLKNNVTLTGTGGVTIVVNTSYAMSIGNNLRLSLTAPTSGATAGMALVSRSTNSSALVQTISNNAALNIVGAIYFPSQKVEISNNGALGTSQCTQLIARLIVFDNNATFNANCAGTGALAIGAAGAKLAE